MNFIKCTAAVMQEYGIDVTTVRVLADLSAIKHFELTDPMWAMMKDDIRVEYWTQEAILAYIEFVIGE